MPKALAAAYSAAMTLKILLADDNQTFLTSVKSVLAMFSQAEVVGDAHNGAQALEMAQRLQPDLVLLDIVMPGMTGLDVARIMKTWPQPPKVVFLSLHDNVFYRAAARELGALGLVGKANFVIELFPMIAGLMPDFQDNHATETGCAS
jgi:DNA-binding NarL/FixJ family response regulator